MISSYGQATVGEVIYVEVLRRMSGNVSGLHQRRPHNVAPRNDTANECACSRDNIGLVLVGN
jgi:hypothetical protein